MKCVEEALHWIENIYQMGDDSRLCNSPEAFLKGKGKNLDKSGRKW